MARSKVTATATYTGDQFSMRPGTFPVEVLDTKFRSAPPFTREVRFPDGRTFAVNSRTALTDVTPITPKG